MLTLSDIKSARERVSRHILRTPLLRVPALDKPLCCEVYLKPENLQYTGSFKLRGATSRLTLLTEEQRAGGVVTASSGNHAKALACAAARLGVKATVIMPTDCNRAKLAGVESYGATVLFEGTLSGQRNAKARAIVEEQGSTLVHSHADPLVIAGQGTIGLEIMEDLPELDAVVAPLGGGGLLSGIATAVKSLKPSVRVIGTEPAGAARYAASRRSGRPMTLEHVDTVADGTRCDHADPDNFAVIERYVDSLVTAEEQEISAAVKQVVEAAKLVAEPSSVLGIAAAAAGKLPVGENDKVCFVITGGNNDLGQLARMLSQ
jgi:threonine dehydratase